MRKILSCLAFLLLATACSRQGTTTDNTTQRPDSAALKVAVMPTIDCLPLYLAAERNLFAQQGVKVQLLRFKAQMDCDTALERGRAEGMMSDLVRTELMQRRGTPLHYAAATALDWQLLSNKTARIKQPAQLYDKMVAMARHSGTDLLATLVVSQAAIEQEHVYRIQVNDVCNRLNWLERGIIDALFLPEPQATQARLAGSPVILDTRHNGPHLGVLAFRQQAMDSCRQQIDAFIKAYNAACDSLNSKGLKRYRLLIEKYCGVKPATIDSLPAGIRFPHAEEPQPADLQAARQWIDNL